MANYGWYKWGDSGSCFFKPKVMERPKAQDYIKNLQETWSNPCNREIVRYTEAVEAYCDATNYAYDLLKLQCNHVEQRNKDLRATLKLIRKEIKTALALKQR